MIIVLVLLSAAGGGSRGVGNILYSLSIYVIGGDFQQLARSFRQLSGLQFQRRRFDFQSPNCSRLSLLIFCAIQKDNCLGLDAAKRLLSMTINPDEGNKN